jgi:hypothetical protein
MRKNPNSPQTHRENSGIGGYSAVASNGFRCSDGQRACKPEWPTTGREGSLETDRDQIPRISVLIAAHAATIDHYIKTVNALAETMAGHAGAGRTAVP